MDDMYSDKNLAKELIKYVDALSEDDNKSMDDFFDHVGVTEEYRSNFAIGCILKQVCEIRPSLIKKV